eukprot:scaffold26385_cov82-Phaeocystis_antarctica.AAC.6
MASARASAPTRVACCSDACSCWYSAPLACTACTVAPSAACVACSSHPAARIPCSAAWQRDCMRSNLALSSCASHWSRLRSCSCVRTSACQMHTQINIYKQLGVTQQACGEDAHETLRREGRKGEAAAAYSLKEDGLPHGRQGGRGAAAAVRRR